MKWIREAASDICARIGSYKQAEIEEIIASHAPSEAIWSQCPRCDNGIYNGKECAICCGTGRITESLLASEAAAQPTNPGDSAKTPPGFTYEAEVLNCPDCEYESAVHAAHNHESTDGGSWDEYQHIKKRAEIEHNDH